MLDFTHTDIDLARKGKIGVLIVDDSSLNREYLKEIILTDPAFIILDFASNGKEAIKKVESLKPDIVTMDIYMPIMNGYQAIQHIMAFKPTPIIVVTTAELEDNSAIAFDALNMGALDIINRPETPDDINEGLNDACLEFLQKLKLLANIKVITHVRAKLSQKQKKSKEILPSKKVVVIASSTGGPKALKEIFDHLPITFLTPIVVVQHMAKGFIPGLVKWLNSNSLIPVNIAKEGTKIQPKNIYIAPSGKHLKITYNGILHFDDSPPINGLKPAADILFESASDVYKAGVLGVVLTGMGNDGTKGCQFIKREGGKIIVQNAETSIIASMPLNVKKNNLADAVKPIDEIAVEIQKQMMFI